MGPTASGKTDLAVHLATKDRFEIISVDSAMIYRGMDIGTAKPEPAVLDIAPHHLIDIRNPDESYFPHVTLVSRSGPGVIPCKLGRPWAENSASSVRRPAGSFANEPYSHQIVAECSTYAYVTGDVKERYEAPIDFVPESGRLYTVHMDEEDPNFVFVTDVSADVRTVAYVRATKTL